MRIQNDTMSTGSDRSALDRHAVTAAGQLLMSAIWLEHRVRRFSTRVMGPSQRTSVAAVVSSSDAHNPDQGCSYATVGSTESTPHEEAGTHQ